MSETSTHRPLIMGRRAAVASNHPAATQLGLEVLRLGGGAADAAVAISLALGVAEPAMSGLGGDGFYHFFRAADGDGVVYNGSGPAPRGVSAADFRKGGLPRTGPRSAGIPGALGALAALHAAQGRLPWQALCEPVAALARAGVPVTRTYRRYARLCLTLLRADALAAEAWLRDREVPALGTPLPLPALAATLDLLGAEGPEGFYRGRLAAALLAGARAAGVPFQAEDLAGCRPLVQAPLVAGYRGIEVRQTPPNSTGFALLQQLRILEHFDLAALEPGSAELVHLMVEAKKRAFLARERYGAEGATLPPDFLSWAEAAREAAMIDPARAADLPMGAAGPGNTTYFCVIDEAGDAVSGIQSLNTGYGSGVVAGETGIVLNNRMVSWHLHPAHPNFLRPGGRVRHTMNAPVLLREGRLWAVLGTPGADDQVQVNAQAIVALVDHGLDPQQAAEAPRWSSSQPGQDSKWPHRGQDALELEEGLPPATAEVLRGHGHAVKLLRPLAGPGSLSCIRLLENGIRMAGSDPRRDGWAGAL
jgi:gamma-glutamyltranspeptidase